MGCAPKWISSLWAGSSAGGGIGGGFGVTGSAKQQQQQYGGNNASTVLNTAVMNKNKMGDGVGVSEASGVMHSSLKRYGDFYGHSSPAGENAADALSEQVKIPNGVKNTDVLNRFKIPEVIPVVETVSNNAISSTAPVKEDAIVTAPPEIKALVRGRGRVDHSAASQALQSAFQTPSTSTAKVRSNQQEDIIVGPSTTAAMSASTAAGNGPRTAEESVEFKQQQLEYKEQLKNKPPKYKFKIKSKRNTEGTGANSGGESAEEGEQQLQKEWKGSKGVIGRY